MWITTNSETLLERWESQTTLPASWETCLQVKKQQLKLGMKQLTGSKLMKYVKAICCHLFIQLINKCRVHHVICQAVWFTSWNQDCWEKYQQPQIFRWYHCNGRKWRGTEKLLEEGEREEWKCWLKTQHSENDHGIWSHHFVANRWGNSGNSDRLYPTSLQMVTSAMKLKDAYSLEEKLWLT